MNKNTTKQDIIILAQALMQSRGFNAFSYQDIADGLSIKKASVHHHFAAKEDLGAEVIKQMALRFKTWIDAIPSSLTVRERLDHFSERTRSFIKRSDLICISGICSAEWNTLPPKMKIASAAYENLRRDWLISVFTEGQGDGSIKTTSLPSEQADFYLAAGQGAIQKARSQESAASFDKVLKLAREAIEVPR